MLLRQKRMKTGWATSKLTKTSKAVQGGQEELCKWARTEVGYNRTHVA